MSAKTSRDKVLGEDSDRLLGRTRDAIGDIGGISEMKMFGGVGFLLDGNLLAGASKRGLLLDGCGQGGAHPCSASGTQS